LYIGKRVVLNVGKEKTCAYKEQRPVASQQNIAKYFSLFPAKLISDGLEILRVKKKV
jgi:hypothetical protein